MKKCFPLLTAVLCAVFATVFSSGLRAAPGDLEATFDPNTDGYVYDTTLQPDGKIIIGGDFISLKPNGTAIITTRRHIARLNSDGSLDTTFNPTATNIVYNTALQPDGKIVVGGIFTTLQPNGAASVTTRNHIARLNSDGSLDTTFDPNANKNVLGLTLQTDGKIVVCGNFTTLQPNGAASATVRNYIARLNSDGSLDTAFNPNASYYVYNMALQPDGKIIVGGNFGNFQPNGAASATTRRYIARLNSDGSLDTAFNPNANGYVNSTVLQPDGKIIVCGTFTTLQPNGAASATIRRCIARLNSDGSLDTAFNPNANGEVLGLTLQVDGKIIVCGNFTTLQPNGAASATVRNRIARLNSDGSLDTTFDPNANNVVNNAVVQGDGKIVVVGNFDTLQPNGAASATTRNGIARLVNDPVLQRLTVSGSQNNATVQLLRAGALPEVQQVTFEASGNGGATWTGLTAASRVSNGWRVTGYKLPAASGLVRARARFSSGYYNGASGVLEVVAPYPAPDIVVEQPENTVLVPGGSTVDYGEAALGTALTRTFTIRNPGSDVLHVSSLKISGVGVSEFIMDTSSTNDNIGSADFTTFTVTFAPTSTNGVRNATLSIASDGPSNPYGIVLTGLGLSATTSTGNDGLSDHAKYTLRALGFDYQLSQPALVQALYGGASTAGLYTTAQVQALNVGTPLIQRDASTGQFKLTIAVQQSANLQTFTPLSLATGTSTFNAAGALEFRFTSPSGAQFYRLQSQ